MVSRGRCPTVGGGEVCIFCCFQYFVKNRKSKVSLVKRDNRAMQLYRFFFTASGVKELYVMLHAI